MKAYELLGIDPALIERVRANVAAYDDPAGSDITAMIDALARDIDSATASDVSLARIANSLEPVGKFYADEEDEDDNTVLAGGCSIGGIWIGVGLAILIFLVVGYFSGWVRLE